MSQPNPEIESHVRDITEQLGESDYGPVRQVRMIVQHAGVEFAHQTLQETLEIQASGGMATADGGRRRSAGGVYFYLAKGKLNASLRQIIFPGYGQSVKGAAIEWESRQQLVQPLLAEQTYGELTMAPRITLHGRARSIQANDNSYVMILEHELEPMAYGRGIPTPPSDPTLYAVYMGKGQYERVEKALKKNMKDHMVVEGTCMLDAETSTISVFALTVTTRMTEKKLRQDQRNPIVTGQDDDATATLPGRPQVAQNPRKARQEKRRQVEAVKEARTQNSARSLEAAPAAAGAPMTTDIPRTVATNAEAVLPVSNSGSATAETNDTLQQLRELERAAVTLRERIIAMESRRQPGVAMTRKILENTERQIEALRREI